MKLCAGLNSLSEIYGAKCGVQNYSHLRRSVWYIGPYTQFTAGSGIVSVMKHIDFSAAKYNIL